MDEIWEKAVETALEGHTDHASVRSLTLDGAVKCVHGRLPHPSVFERFPNLQHLCLANIGVSSLEQFPRLVNLNKLVLSDNRIAGGLECLVEAGLGSLVDLDLSNNRIQFIEDLVPLAELRLVSLDLYECPITRVKDYRARVFGLIKSLKYLDKMDAEENETPESDEEDEEEDEDDGEEDDPGSGEVDGGDRPTRMENGHGSVAADGILDVDEDEESDANEEEDEIVANEEYVQHEANGFRMVRADEVGGDENDDEFEEDNSSGEEIDEEDVEDEVVEVHEVLDSDDEDDGVEYEEDEEDDSDEGDDDEEEVDNKEQGTRIGSSTGRFASAEGEIDGHEQGEDDAYEDDNGETGEEDEQRMEEERDFEEDAEEEDEYDDEENGSGYLVQPVNQHAIANDDDELSGGSDMDPVNDIEDEEEDEDIFDEEDVEDDLDNNHQVSQVQVPPSSSSQSKRNRSDGDGDGDGDGDDSGEKDDTVHQAKLPKKDP